MTREDDLYRALGLERTASQEEIRKAYKTTGAFYLRM
jgi:curved DNA-binding protein CbpA